MLKIAVSEATAGEIHRATHFLKAARRYVLAEANPLVVAGKSPRITDD